MFKITTEEKNYIVYHRITAEKDWKKGDRVVVNLHTKNDPEYYAGVVKTIRSGKLFIEFDDGDTYKISEKSKKIFPGNNKKRKSEIPADKVKKYLELPLKTPKNRKISDECYELFENYLFGDQFGDPEPNTDYENRVWEALEKFVYGTGNRGSNKNNFKDFFRSLQQCKPFYKLLTPKNKQLYRGVDLLFNQNMEKAKAQLRNLKKLGKPRLIKGNSYASKGFYLFDNYSYKPKSLVQSWTSDIHVAYLFSGIDALLEEHGGDFGDDLSIELPLYDAVPAILIAKTDDSFFGTPKLSDRVNPTGREAEIFRLGGTISCQIMIPVHSFEEAGLL